MTKGNYYTQRSQYIKDLEKVLEPIQDFYRLRYAHEYYTEAEYIQLANSLGDAIFIDITAVDLEGVFKDVARAINGLTPKGIVTDLAKRRHIAELFLKIA